MIVLRPPTTKPDRVPKSTGAQLSKVWHNPSLSVLAVFGQEQILQGEDEAVIVDL
jgi:hypothetical protein